MGRHDFLVASLFLVVSLTSSFLAGFLLRDILC